MLEVNLFYSDYLNHSSFRFITTYTFCCSFVHVKCYQNMMKLCKCNFPKKVAILIFEMRMENICQLELED